MTEENTATIGAPIDFKDRKVCVAFPSPDLVHVDFCNDLMQLVTQSSQFVKLGLTNANSSRIADNRNTIVEHARQLACTDILWIDADTKFPISGLMHLLMHDKDIVCATTCRRKGTSRAPVATPLDYSTITPQQKLIQMRFIGFPFMLTRMTVFDKMDEMGLAPDNVYFSEAPRWMMRKAGWNIEGDAGLVAEDEYWCYLARKAGFEIWCDMELSMAIGHLGYDCFYIQNSGQEAVPRVDEAL
jgi:hypothetical protein